MNNWLYRLSEDLDKFSYAPLHTTLHWILCFRIGCKLSSVICLNDKDCTTQSKKIFIDNILEMNHNWMHCQQSAVLLSAEPLPASPPPLYNSFNLTSLSILWAGASDCFLCRSHHRYMWDMGKPCCPKCWKQDLILIWKMKLQRSP